MSDQQQHERPDERGVMSSEDRMVYMANQIARNFATMPEDQATIAVADHLASFWDPRMRALIAALVAQGDPRVGAVATAAVHRLGAGG